MRLQDFEIYHAHFTRINVYRVYLRSLFCRPRFALATNDARGRITYLTHLYRNVLFYSNLSVIMVLHTVTQI